MPTWTATPAQVERVVAAVLPHASAATDLPLFNAVRLELDGDRLLAVASDRYSLVVCRASLKQWDENAKPVKGATAHIRVADVKRLLAFLRPQRRMVATWKLTASHLTVSFAGGSSLTVPTSDSENFPQWRALVTPLFDREPEPGARMGFTPRVVEHFHQSAKALGELHETWQFISPLKPVIVRIGDDFLGLLMPCRLDPDAHVSDLAAFGIATAKEVAA